MKEKIDPTKISVGVVGLGLMGCSITTCLLIAGHPVVAIAPVSVDLEHAEKRITEHLKRAAEEGMIHKQPPDYFKNLIISEDYSDLTNCKLVIECTIENLAIKQSVYEKIEAVILKDAMLTSNTSAIPISILQGHTKHAERFFGLHWAEPSILRVSSKSYAGSRVILARVSIYMIFLIFGAKSLHSFERISGVSLRTA